MSRAIVARSVCSVASALVLAGAPAFAQQPVPPLSSTPEQIREELNRLRQEFETLRESYGARLSTLESKLAQIEGRTPIAQAPATPAVQAPTGVAQPTPPSEAGVPPGAAGAGGPQGALPVYGSTTALSKIFNPDIAVIGNFTGAAGRNEINPGPALDLSEAESSFQAIVDPYARADFFLAFSPEGVEIEEGFITFPTLPGGLLAKVGKLKQQVGKVNTLHAHALPWVDNPLVMQNLLGGEEGLADSGISVSRLILNPVMFLEATGEVYRGSSGVFESHSRGDLSYVGRLRGYRDVSESANVDIGASIAWGKNDVGPSFNTRIFAVDASFRYRPLRRAIYRRFLGRSELFWSRREQEDATPNAFGMYASGEYQFARRWFAGARYDWSERATDSSLVDKGPSLLLTYWPSEFSQVRGQYRRIRHAEGTTSNELLFQFLFSIGAHGAHVF
ncbi:MAG: TonB-dependent receptor [Vicinamibacterales bacterium]